MRRPKVWISLLMLLVIGLHALPVLSWQGHRQTRWPILSWAMYAKSYPAGPVETFNRWVVAVSAQGNRINLTPTMAGMNSRPAMAKYYLRPLGAGDTAVAQELFRRINHDRTDSIIELRAEGEQFVVTDTGLARLVLPPMTYRPSSTSIR
jgi:hypothetical protein